MFAALCSLIDARDPAIDGTPPTDDELFECSTCNCNVGSRTKHCRLCNKCVSVFDHHCNWLNTCIGNKNYTLFLILILCVFIFTASVTVLGIHQIVLIAKSEDHQRLIFNNSYWNGSSAALVYGFGGFLIFLNGCLSILVLQLILLHMYLLKKGYTTYEYIISKAHRAKEISDQIQHEAKNSGKDKSNKDSDTCLDWIVFSKKKKENAKNYGGGYSSYSNTNNDAVEFNTRQTNGQVSLSANEQSIADLVIDPRREGKRCFSASCCARTKKLKDKPFNSAEQLQEMPSPLDDEQVDNNKNTEEGKGNNNNHLHISSSHTAHHNTQYGNRVGEHKQSNLHGMTNTETEANAQHDTETIDVLSRSSSSHVVGISNFEENNPIFNPSMILCDHLPNTLTMEDDPDFHGERRASVDSSLVTLNEGNAKDYYSTHVGFGEAASLHFSLRSNFNNNLTFVSNNDKHQQGSTSENCTLSLYDNKNNILSLSKSLSVSSNQALIREDYTDLNCDDNHHHFPHQSIQQKPSSSKKNWRVSEDTNFQSDKCQELKKEGSGILSLPNDIQLPSQNFSKLLMAGVLNLSASSTPPPQEFSLSSHDEQKDLLLPNDTANILAKNDDGANALMTTCNDHIMAINHSQFSINDIETKAPSIVTSFNSHFNLPHPIEKNRIKNSFHDQNNICNNPTNNNSLLTSRSSIAIVTSSSSNDDVQLPNTPSFQEASSKQPKLFSNSNNPHNVVSVNTNILYPTRVARQTQNVSSASAEQHDETNDPIPCTFTPFSSISSNNLRVSADQISALKLKFHEPSSGKKLVSDSIFGLNNPNHSQSSFLFSTAAPSNNGVDYQNLSISNNNSASRLQTMALSTNPMPQMIGSRLRHSFTYQNSNKFSTLLNTSDSSVSHTNAFDNVLNHNKNIAVRHTTSTISNSSLQTMQPLSVVFENNNSARSLVGGNILNPSRGKGALQHLVPPPSTPVPRRTAQIGSNAQLQDLLTPASHRSSVQQVNCDNMSVTSAMTGCLLTHRSPFINIASSPATREQSSIIDSHVQFNEVHNSPNKKGSHTIGKR